MKCVKILVQLAKEIKLDADVIVPVPDSGVPAAIGYAYESKFLLSFGIIRNHYVGRRTLLNQQIKSVTLELN